jgi:hypothetical protein
MHLCVSRVPHSRDVMHRHARLCGEAIAHLVPDGRLEKVGATEFEPATFRFPSRAIYHQAFGSTSARLPPTTTDVATAT